MTNIKLFIWFCRHSWLYMAGMRKDFILGFWPSWRRFYELNKEGERDMTLSPEQERRTALANNKDAA